MKILKYLKIIPSPGGRGSRGGGPEWGHPHPNPLPRLPKKLFGGQASRERGKEVFSNSRRSRMFFLILFAILPLVISVSYAAPLKLRDEVGREVVFPFPLKRIVSLAPNITEILFGLGLDEEIVGVSIHCNYPDKVKDRVRVGSYVSLDFERIVSLKPDLIIATGAGNTREMVERLERLGFPTFVIFPKKFDDVLRSVGHLGQVVAREKEALSIIQSMKRRKERVVEQTRAISRPKVFLQIGESRRSGKEVSPTISSVWQGERILQERIGRCILDWEWRRF